MKRVPALVLVILVLTVHNAPAQMRHMRERIERQRELGPPSALKVVGVSSIVIGGTGALLGLDVYVVTGDTGGRGGNNSNNNSKPDPLGITMMAVGGGLVVAGICLLVIDHNHSGRHHHFTIAAPKRNEAGIAYNF